MNGMTCAAGSPTPDCRSSSSALLYTPEHSLIDQSLHSQLGAETTNGDGFGVGWYGDSETPGSSRAPNRPGTTANLRELAGHIMSRPRLRAHPRVDGLPVQRTNCHPFRHGRWLWMHNGVIASSTT